MSTALCSSSVKIMLYFTGMTILWLLSLMSLLASIKLESLDLIIMNSVLLTIVMIYVIIHALFTCILYVYYVSLKFLSKFKQCLIICPRKQRKKLKSRFFRLSDHNSAWKNSCFTEELFFFYKSECYTSRAHLSGLIMVLMCQW